MKKLLTPRIVACLLLTGMVTCICSSVSRAEEPKVSIEYREQVTAFFADAKAQFHFKISSTEEVAGTISWSLAAKGRVLASGDLEARPAPEEPTTLAIERQLPPLREGVAFTLQLKVAFKTPGAKQPLAEVSHDLWLFSDNPFINRQKRLEELEIQLFDPTGDSATALEKLEVPFKHLHNVDTLRELSRGTVIIGEGTSLKEFPSLSSELPALAARGVMVVCMAASDGEFVLPVQASDDNRAAALFSLRRMDVVGQLDKRLGSPRWVSEDAVELRELKISTIRAQTTAEIVEPGKGWPWLEVHYKEPAGRLVYCGLGLMKAWDQSPVPRYLLASLLESLPQEAAKRMKSND